MQFHLLFLRQKQCVKALSFCCLKTTEVYFNLLVLRQQQWNSSATHTKLKTALSTYSSDRITSKIHHLISSRSHFSRSDVFRFRERPTKTWNSEDKYTYNIQWLKDIPNEVVHITVLALNFFSWYAQLWIKTIFLHCDSLRM